MRSPSPKLLVAGFTLMLLALAVLLAGAFETPMLSTGRFGALALFLAQSVQDLATPVAVILALSGMVVGLGGFTAAG